MPVLDAAQIAAAALDHEATGAVPPPASKASSRGRGEKAKDKIPKPGGSATGRARATRASSSERMSAETKAMGRAIGQLLTIPGGIFGMIGDPFLGDQVARNPDGSIVMRPGEFGPEPVVIPGHFSQTGPAFGMQLAEASETNPAMRAFFKKAMAGDSFAVLLMGGVAYAAPPLVYLLTPPHSPLRNTFGVPQRPGRIPAYAADSETPDDPDGAPETEPDTPEG